jgi:hypothetical protein
VNTNLNDCAYMASLFNHSHEITKYDWLLDSGTTSHICTIRDAFTEFRAVEETLNGVGKGTPVKGRGTVNLKFEFDFHSPATQHPIYAGRTKLLAIPQPIRRYKREGGLQ